MKYSQILKSIEDWKGPKLEYWKAVKILEDAEELNNIELKIVKVGLSFQSRALVLTKIDTLKKKCEAQLLELNGKSNNVPNVIKEQKNVQAQEKDTSITKKTGT